MNIGRPLRILEVVPEKIERDEDAQVVRRIILRFPASEAYCKLLADRYECDVIVEKEYRTLSTPEGR